ncbi:MAG: hypothetical protein JW864_06850 [Spirochaetes bacterium]|nr:hypothetical protein [Spirochaetota bacterium]
MKSVAKIFIILALFCFTVTPSVYAITVSGSAPTVTVTIDGADATQNAAATLALQTALDAAFLAARTEANLELNKYDDQPKLAKGFANANIYAAQAATHQGFQDYSLFAVTTGIMFGVQLPSSDPGYYDKIDQKIEDEGDLYAGVGTGLSIANVGINAGFLYPGLYLSAKFGTIKLDGDSFSDDMEGSTMKSTLFAIGANYSWISTKSFLAGLVKWRGVSFGTGFLYNKNEIDVEVDVDPIDQPISGVSAGPHTLSGTLTMDPSIILGIHSSTYTIPFDVTTSVRLLWVLNFNLGAGIDFNFGSTDIIIRSDGSVTADIEDNPNVDIAMDPGTVSIDGSTKDEKPSFVHARITTGIGLNILPVKIDIPVIIYPFDSAVAVGLTAGVVW